MPTNSKPAALRFVLLEAIAVGAVGFALSLLANQLSPRGLVLSRDYFGDASGATPMARPAASAANESAAELNRDGLRVVKLDGALRWQADLRRERGLILFVDARAEHAFRDGHIPGAIQFDHFYPEQRLAEVLAACSLAEQVVIYCTGGDCADSILAARLLREAGVPAERLAIFVGGISDWKIYGETVEVGARNSGVMRTP